VRLKSLATLGRRAKAYHAPVGDFDALRRDGRIRRQSISADFPSLVNNTGIASRGHSVADTDLEWSAVRVHAFAHTICRNSQSRICAQERPPATSS
jgi:hypothetical protein